MKITRKHLKIFDLYEGKIEGLLKIGTPKEKALFQNGEFEKITELIKMWADNHPEFEKELNSFIKGHSDKKSIIYLSKKYCGPKKENSIFKNVMDMLWAAFG